MSEINNYTTAAANIPSRRIFAPYFKARWQNLQNVVNDTQFYNIIPPRFKTYYRAYVEQWLEWSRGFVPQLHKQDFFSTGVGYTVCDIFTRECMSGGWRIDSSEDATDSFFEKWQHGEMEVLLNEMFFKANAGGNALLCLTPVDGDIYPSVYGANRFIFDIGRSGEISHAVLFNRFSTSKDGFYALETRLAVDGRAYYLVQLNSGSGQALSPSWCKSNSLTEVPEEIQTQWKYCYGDIMPNVWHELPDSIGIGLWNCKNKATAAAIADLPGYSDSTLHTALDVLYSIDFNYTSAQMDMYWARTRVLLPREMQTRVVNTGVIGGRVSMPCDNIDAVVEAQLSDDIYCKIVESTAIDGKPIEPVFMQPDHRGEAHKYIRDADLELLASKVGLSSSTLANHLSYNQSKTATQVFAEEDTTATSVNNKRALACVAIDAMLKAVARFYSLSEDAHLVWNRYGINTPQENATLLNELNSGIMTKREYLKRRFTNLTDKQIDAWLEELKSEDANMLREFNLGGS